MNGIVILGAGGRLGAALAREWAAAGETVHAFSRHELDICDFAAVERVLAAWQPREVVNCAALTNVDYCETHPDEAHQVNATAVGELGALCQHLGARCTHLSTDYVFAGTKTAPYSEEDEPRPLSHYGKSKLAGEQALLASGARHLVVRVSWVFGPDRPSFIDSILQQAQQQETVRAIADKWSTPTYTADAAQLLHAVLQAPAAKGVIHLCNGGSCTWQEYGQWALDCAARAGIRLKATRVEPQALCDMAAFVAARPVYTSLATAKLVELTSITPRPWQDAVAAYIRDKAAKA